MVTRVLGCKPVVLGCTPVLLHVVMHVVLPDQEQQIRAGQKFRGHFRFQHPKSGSWRRSIRCKFV